MEKLLKKITIIKYGTNTLVKKNESGDFSIDYVNIKNQGGVINNFDGPIIIVSSGAVGLGKTVNGFDYIEDGIIRKRVLSAAGNPHLSMEWNKVIPNKTVLQALITHKDFTNDASKESLKSIIYNIYQNPNNAVVQVNDNDFITDEELKLVRGGDFGDNDKTATLLAEICAEIFGEVELIINTSSDGVTKDGKSVTELKNSDLNDQYIESLCGENKSDIGTGGMANKLKIIRDLLNKGLNISISVINGKKPEQLKKVLNGEVVNTRII